MRYSIRRAITVMALAALAGGIPAFSHGGVLRTLPAAAGTTQTCSGIMTGLINGNLLVSGICLLEKATLTGSIAMIPRSELIVQESSVGGNISGKNVAIGISLSTIHGNINITGTIDSRISPKVLSGSNIEIEDSLITGTVYGSSTHGIVCGSNIHGSINFVLANLTIGDPGDGICSGDTIGGGIILTAFGGEIEGNTIGGSVNITNSSDIELASNTIAGSATCSSDSFLSDGDSAPNTTKGSNTC